MADAGDRKNGADDENRAVKEKIIEAASRIYEKKGFHETSVAEIAEAAGISVPVTYHYVSKKSDIMLLIMENFTRKFKESVQPELETIEDPAQKLRKAMDVYYRIVNEDMVKVILVYRKSRTLDRDGRRKIMAAELEHIEIFKIIVQDGVKAGVFKETDADMAAYNILMTAHTWALKNWHLKKRFSLQTYLDSQYKCLMDALKA